MYCLHDQTQCPNGQIVHYRHDSVVRCGKTEIPIAAAHNTQDGIPKAEAPESCPLRPAKKSKKATLHVVEQEPVKTNKCWRRKPRSKFRLFNDDQVIDIRKRAAAGEGSKQIAKSYGVNQSSVCQVINHITYKDVG